MFHTCLIHPVVVVGLGGVGVSSALLVVLEDDGYLTTSGHHKCSKIIKGR